MSGICALYSLDGVPCNRDLLERMSQAMSRRGDVTGLWSEGAIGLAMTAWKSQRTPQDAALPYFWQRGACRIAADARLDNRAVLIQTLKTYKVPLVEESDAELLAAAYSLWAEHCVGYLQGDFAFVLWDARRQRLFAARSPMGLRPFVYHVNRQRFLCASEAKQLLEDPAVSKDLNDAWITMWLTEGIDHWSETAYREIEELVPGHTLMIDAHGMKKTPFWTPSPRDPLVYPTQLEYTEHFRSLLFDAVRDRMRSDRPLLFDLSGGFDSSSIVCVARKLLGQGNKMQPISAVHVSSNRYREVDDRAYARLVAEVYSIDVHYLSYEEYPAFDGAFSPRHWISTPTIPTLFLTKLYQKQWQLAQTLGVRGHLRGDFGDQLLSASLSYLTTYWDECRYDEFWREVLHWERIHGMNRDDLFAAWVLKPQQHRRRQQKERSTLAPWVKPEIWKKRAELLRQDDSFFREACPDPLARQLLMWMRRHKEYVSMQEDGILAAGLETCEPYTDMRLVEFMLRTPPQYQIRPGQRKFLLWASMEGILPESIRQRKEKGRVSRILFRGVAQHHNALRELVLHLPEVLTTYIDAELLAASIDRAALGDDVNQPTFFSALALVFWAHRLPWAGGKLPRLSPVRG